MSQPPSQTPAFVLRDVGKSFDTGTVALTGVSLTIAQGSFVSIVGPSGCGKSTLLSIMAGLTAPTTGNLDGAAQGNVGFVFQDPTLMPWATARDNVLLPFRLAGSVALEEARRRADDALARVGLGDFVNAYPRELSGGMRMRVSLARAMVTHPGVLLLDEPFAALDEFSRFRLNGDLLDLWRKNQWTTVFVTHSIREAVFLSQRVIVMSPRPGRIIADIPVTLPQERNAQTRFTHDFTDQCAHISALLGESTLADAS